MALSVLHRLRNQTYTCLPEGRVRVEDHKTGHVGIFLPTGQWVSGELKAADVHMLEWVALRGQNAG